MEFNAATTSCGIQNLQFTPDGFPHWLFTKSLKNTKHNILNLRNFQLKLLLQIGLQQQQKTPEHTDVELKKTCGSQMTK